MLFESGRYAEARRTLDETSARFPGDVATRHLLARLLAVSPDDAVRDGARAVELAQSVVDEQPALDHLETLAMAMAEAGRFDDAVTWQQRALEAERQAAGGNSPQRLDRLALYQARSTAAGALTVQGIAPARVSGARRAIGHALCDRAVDLLRRHQDARRHLDAAASVQGQ